MAREQIPGKDNQQLVSPDNTPLLIYHTYSIRIPIKGNSKVSRGLGHPGNQGLKVFRERWIRMVIRKSPVRLAKKGNNVKPAPPVDIAGHRTAGSITGIHNDPSFDWTGHNIFLQIAEIRINHIGLLQFSMPLSEII